MPFSRLPARPALFIALACLLAAAAVAAPKADPVRVHYESNSDDSYSLFADNDLLIPSYIHIEFTALENLTCTVPLPFETILPAGAQRVELFRLIPARGKSTHFNYSWLYIPGDPIDTVPDADFPYQLPFAHGAKFKLVQGFNGRFTHSGQNQYAVDFDMPEGTPVHAARDGLVMDTKADSNIGGPGPEYNQYNNYIRVWHDDGTFGNYVHLKKDGVAVQVGDRVAAGQLIGYSGNTGRSSGPHLHFDVRVPTRKGETQSIPFVFMNYDGQLVAPQAGRYYFGVHPGLPSFRVELGSMLSNDDFKGYIQKAAATGKIDFRTEQVDDTIIVYVFNGTRNTVKATAGFKLDNLGSSAGNPVTVSVPPLAEVFLTLLNPLDPAESYGYGASLNASWTR